MGNKSTTEKIYEKYPAQPHKIMAAEFGYSLAQKELEEKEAERIKLFELAEYRRKEIDKQIIELGKQDNLIKEYELKLMEGESLISMKYEDEIKLRAEITRLKKRIHDLEDPYNV